MMSDHPKTSARSIRAIVPLLVSLGVGLVAALDPYAAAQAQGPALGISQQFPAQIEAQVGETHNFTTQASGGNPPYEFTSSGSVPGLVLTTTPSTNPTQAALSGAYARTGTYPFSLTVTDASSAALTTSTVFTITDGSKTHILSTASDGPQGQYMVGYPVWVSVSVNPQTDGSGIPTGSATVTSGTGNPTCAVTLDSSGLGSCALYFTAAGMYTLQAAYIGDDYYSASQTLTGTDVSVQALALDPQLSAGAEHTCYLGPDGLMLCWGENQYYPASVSEPFTAISTGYYQTCGLKSNGSIQCWSDDPAITSVPAGKYLAVSAGNSFVCAIDARHKVACWGSELTADWTGGIPTFKVKAISAGGSHACVLRESDSTVYCWGGNLDGVNLPASPMQSLAAGRRHTCGIATGGALACWGPSSLTITPPGGTYTQLGSGSDYSCALDSDAQLHCWGANAPAVNSSAAYQALAVGYLHVCALTAGSPATLACWGSNMQGQAPRLSLSPAGFRQILARGADWSQTFTPQGGHTSGYVLTPQAALPGWLSQDGFAFSGTPDATQVDQVALTLSEAPGTSDLPLALEPVEEAYTWSVEEPATTISITDWDTSATTGAPIEVTSAVSEEASPVLSGQVVISGGAETECQTEVVPNADGNGGTATCTLFFATQGTKTISASYQGNGFYQPSATDPLDDSHQVAITPAVIQPMVSAGDQFSCSLNADGAATCWGKNDSGQTLPPSDDRFQRLSAGQSYACGLLTSSQIACWGWNGVSAYIPTYRYGYVSVGAGESHACALDWAGQITCWGSSDSRTTGAPTRYGFSSLSVGETHSCAIDSYDGKPVCWGMNTYGEDNVPAAFSAPDSRALSVAAGGSFSCALDADNQATCWGGSAGPSDPIRAAPTDKFQSISAGHNFACGIRSADDSLACWGANGSGQLNSPAGQFSSVSAGNGHACALTHSGDLVCWGNNGEGQAPVLSITPTQLGTIDQGASYQVQLHAAGGRSGSYQYHNLSALPAGLALDSSTGRVSGTPALGGSYHFDVQVTERARDPYLQSSFHFDLLVRSPVQVTITPPAITLIAGSQATLRVSVAETERGKFGVAPTGTITLTLDDGQRCISPLDDAEASCTFFLIGPVQATASYPGSDMFLPGAVDQPTRIDVAPYQETAGLLTDANRTYLHKADGSLSCFGAACATNQLTGIYPHVASSENVVCALGTNGEVTCYDNHSLRLSAPAGPFFDLAAGSTQVCGLRADGSALCWQTTDASQTQAVAGSYLSLKAAGENFCAFTTGHGLACWGAGALTPPISGQYAALAVAAEHACALTDTGEVACWGDDQAGQSNAPAGTGFTQVAVGTGFSCTLNASGAISCWGDDSLAQTDAPFGFFSGLAAGDDHACGLRPGQEVTCWGKNEHGEAPQFTYQAITATELPAQRYWQHYFYPNGGLKPYQATVSSGALPAGIALTLSQSGIVLYGTPTVPQDYAFTIRWEDSSPIHNVLEIPIVLRVTGADLKVSIQGSHPTTALLENAFSFTYTIENTTELDVPEARLEVSLPANLSEIQVMAGLECSQAAQALSCPIHSFTAHSQRQVTVSGVVIGQSGAPLATRAAVEPVSSGWTELKPDDNWIEFQVTTARRMTVFQDGFDGNGLDPAWSQGSVETSPGGQQYLGHLANDTVNFHLGDLLPHQVLSLEFDLYVIGDWEGVTASDGAIMAVWDYGFQGEPGPLFQTTFCNVPGGQQSYPDPFQMGSHPCQAGALEVNSLAYPGQTDARYHFKVTLPHNASDLDFQFAAESLPPSTGWGLDNLVVTVKDKMDLQSYLPVVIR